MSDISSIPGTSSSKYSQMVDDLMEAERIPLTNLEDKIDELENDKNVWQEISRASVDLRDQAKIMYGFENPFNARIAESSNETNLTATATREADQENYSFTVKQVAQGDKFISESIDKDFEVPEGSYRFVIGEKEITIRFRGGKIKNFVEAINEKAEGMLRANLIRNTADTYVFSLEGLKTGLENKVFFADDAVEFGINAGFLSRSGDSEFQLPLIQGNFRKFRNTAVDSSVVQLNDKLLTIKPGGSVSIPFGDTISLRDQYVLEYDINIVNTREDYIEPQPPPGPEEPEIDPLNFEGITIEQKPSVIDLPPWEKPAAPEYTDDLQILFAETGGAVVSLPESADTDGTITKKIPIGLLLNSIDAISIVNNNSHRTVEISNIRIYDPNSTGDYSVKNSVTLAQDAILEMEGVEITRPDNEIDDLITGVTLNLKKAGDEEIDLEIKPDAESIKNEIIKFVGYYNSLMQDIQILLSNDESVIDEIDYYTDDQREKATEKLGLYQGDVTFMQMKSMMQRIMMDAYETGDGLALLAQLGISTNSTGGTIDASRLRGYLEINEETLDQVLENKTESIKSLFGFDSDNDLISDSGVAVRLDNYLTSFVQVGGIISTRLDGLDNRISRTEDDISDLETKLAAKEEDYRREFGIMEGTMNQLQGTSDSLSNFFNNNNQ